MIKKLLDAGSFDFPTNGHLWKWIQGSKMAEKFVIAVGVNPEKDKKEYMPIQDRVVLIEQIIKEAGLTNVTVKSFPFMYLIHYAQSVNANGILRGIRNPTDYQQELEMRHFNSDIDPSINTIYLTPPRELSGTSSSMVKGLIGPQGWKVQVKKHVPKPVFNYILAKELYKRFEKEWIAAGAVVDFRAEVWAIVSELYSNPDRYYHTLEHIAACLDVLDSIPASLGMTDPYRRTTLCMAIFFHDVIYNAKETDNELQSALVFKELATKSRMPKERVQAVYDMILATKTHSSDDSLTNLMLDIDLSILGADEKDFDEYDRNIRKEYSHVSDSDWAVGRKQFMKKFAERERLFVNNWMHQTYEDKAKANLSRLLESN